MTVKRILTGSLALSALALGGLATAQAQTPGMEPEDTLELEAKKETKLRVAGSFFTRYEYRRHYDDLGVNHPRFGERDVFAYRARFGLATTPIDIGDGQHVILRFVPQASGFWAEGRPSTLSDSAMGVHEAVFRLERSKMWLDVGRFEMNYGDHLVIGNVGWHETGRSFDGARAHIELGKKGAWVDGFITQVAEGRLSGGTTTLGAGDTMFLGVYGALGEYVAPKTALDLYTFAHVSPSIGDRDTAIEGTLGARFKRAIGRTEVRAEAGAQFGKRVAAGATVDTLAFQGEGEVGFKVAPTLRLAVGGFFASGDDKGTTDKDEGWNQLYPTAHKFLGFMDMIGARSNVMGGMIRVHAKAAPKLKLGLDGHVFMRPEPGVNTMGVDNDSYAGVEADLWTLFQVGKGLGLRTAYNIFLPNETGPFGNDQIAHYVEIQFRYDLE